MPRVSYIPANCGAGLFRRLAGMCAIFMLVLQVAFPGAGQTAAGGEWIEICGEFGAVEIQVALEQDGGGQDCPDCSTCALCAAENAAGYTGLRIHGSSRMTDCAVLLPAGAAVEPNPAQYWHDGRGPPLVNNKKNSERALRASVAATQNQGEAPWA